MNFSVLTVIFLANKIKTLCENFNEFHKVTDCFNECMTIKGCIAYTWQQKDSKCCVKTGRQTKTDARFNYNLLCGLMKSKFKKALKKYI